MRIGIDMLGVQSPDHGHRGIGRFGVNLVSTLMARDDGHEFVLYVHDELPCDRVPMVPAANVRRLGAEADRLNVSQRMDRLARTNPDGLDVLLFLSAFEPWQNYGLPSRPLHGLRMAALIHDLIPVLFPSETITDPTLMRYYRSLAELRSYDVLLTNSEATRQDCLALLKLPEDRVVTIGGGCDHRFFTPDDSAAGSEASDRVLAGLGITRPFVLNVGALVERKNTWGLIDAFGRLPRHLRESHQLVLAFLADENEVADVQRRARAIGVREELIFTNEVSDEVLRLLYRRCSAFVLPSRYEGFGLPLLEAMMCGAAVIAGNNSSQIEVVGEAGLLANVDDPTDLAARLAQVLDDPTLARTLRDRARIQAQTFTWERSAERTANTLGALGNRRPSPTRRIDRSHRGKPRIAFFSPLPPRRSGISDYSVRLLRELSRTYEIDLYHDSGYIPDLGLADAFTCRDHRTFARYAPELDYHAVVYQMGNSRHHVYHYETMLRVPGVVTLHDFGLAEFHLHHGHRRGMERGYLLDELLTWYPEHAEAIRARLKFWDRDWVSEQVARDCAREGWYLNRRLLASPNHVVVHSPWCVRTMQETRPDLAARMTVVPFGSDLRRLSETERGAIRDRFGIPRDALMVASFGFIHPEKMSIEALDAFAEVARADRSALFVFVGQEADDGALRRHAKMRELGGRVRFLGRRTLAEFADLAAATDVGVNLRRPPTNGETSAALLNLLSSGVATIVTDVATFSDYPGHVVRKVRWEAEGQEGLRRAIGELARDRAGREAMGQAAWEYVRAHHEWPGAAERYVEVIERCHAERKAARPGRQSPPRPDRVGVDTIGRGG